MEMSPKTKRLNEAFDYLKKGVETNGQLMFVDKTNVNDIAIYNFTSESEDDGFKKKTPKPKTNPIKVEFKENKKKDQPKRKRVNRSKKRIKNEKLSDTLVDERMREATVNLLNTSLELRKSSESKHAKEVPILTVTHAMEPIEDSIQTIPEENIVSRKIIKQQKKADKNLLVNENSRNPPLNETADRTQSPFPELLVEAIVPRDSMFSESTTARMMQKFQEIYERKSLYESERDSIRNLLHTCNSSKNILNITIKSDNLSKDHVKINGIPMDIINTSKPSGTKEQSLPVQKQKRKRKKSGDSVKGTTKKNNSLRLSKERDGVYTVNNTPTRVSRQGSSNLSIEELNAAITNKARVLRERNKTDSRKNNTTVKASSISNFIKGEIDSEVVNISSVYSEKSFDTVGQSPITAHGDLNSCKNDLPPNVDFWKRNIEPRNLEVEDFNQSVKEYFTELNNDIAKCTFGTQNSKSSTSYSSDSEKSMNNDDLGARSKFKDYNTELDENSNKKHTLTLKPKTRLCGITDIENASNKCRVALLKDASKSSNLYFKKAYKNKTSMISKEDKKGKFTSSISPSKLFCEIKPSTRCNSDSSINKECKKNLTNNFNSKITPNSSTQIMKIDFYDYQSSCNSNALLKKFVSGEKIPSTQTSENKRKKAENFGSQRMDAGPSISRVNDWFSRLAPILSQEEASTVDFKDNVSNIMEKLDTTLVEINHDTSKRLARMFAEAQAKLKQVRNERKLLYEKTASELHSGVMQLVDQRFTELNKRSQEMDEQFVAELKERSRNFIIEDCNKKQAMVRLLKEDVQAFMGFNAKKKKP